jgi:methionyl-tRNA formyltransferase
VLAALTAWLPDVAVVAAYGQILPRTLLAVPSKGCVNVHASLLPRWRGASPVQAALLHGDAETGVTLMQMDEGMDTGPILAQRGLAIRPDHSGGSLSSELATLGAQLLIDTLPSYLAGDVTPVAQDDRLSTVAPRLRSSDANLDPTLPASQLERQIRAFSPRPGARFRWGQDALRILDAHVMPGSDAPSGTVLAVPGGLAMATAEGLLVFDRVQLAGGKPVAGNAFLAGHRAILGAVLNRSA